MSLIPPKEGAEPRHLPEAARPATPVALLAQPASAKRWAT